MGLFNLYKPKEYKYRYIYYDPKKEAQNNVNSSLRIRKSCKRWRISSDYPPWHFREMADKNKNIRREQAQKSNVRLIMILIVLLAIAYFC